MLQQDYKTFAVRDAAILTNSYVAGTVIGFTEDFINKGVHLNNQLNIYIDFTIGSLTDLYIKIEFSSDNTTYYQESFSSIPAASGTDTVSLGLHKFTGTGKYRLALPIKDRYIKISAQGNGTVTSSSLSINAVIGIV